jgi:hypothetical protein
MRVRRFQKWQNTRPLGAVSVISLLFVAQLVACLAIIWLLPVFPTQDGPAHLSAHVLIDLAREAIWDIDSLYADYYRVAWRFVPNWLGTSLLVMFGFLLPLPVVEKLLISVALIVFCTGFACLLRRGREDAPVVLLAVPAFGWGFWLHMGFYNYSLGLALLPWGWLFMAQLLERSAGDSRTTKRAAAALCLCSVAAFFAHPIAAIAVLTAAASMWLGHSRLSIRHGLPLALRLGLPLLPLTVLWASFAWMHPTGEHSRWGMQRLLVTSLNLGGLSTYGELQAQFALVLASVLLCLAFSQMWRIHADPDSRSWVVLWALLLLMVLVIPNGDGEFGYISLRVSVLPWLALLPVAAKAPLQAPLTRGVIAVALFSSSVGILLAPLPSQIALSSRLEQWSVLGRKMDYGATAMALDFRRFGASSHNRPRCVLHGVGRIRRSEPDRRPRLSEPHEPFSYHAEARRGFPDPCASRSHAGTAGSGTLG